MLRIKFMNLSCEISLRWMPHDTFRDNLTMVRVKACAKSTNHYPSQGWSWSMPPYCVTRPQNLCFWKKISKLHATWYFKKSKWHMTWHFLNTHTHIYINDNTQHPHVALYWYSTTLVFMDSAFTVHERYVNHIQIIALNTSLRTHQACKTKQLYKMQTYILTVNNITGSFY